MSEISSSFNRSRIVFDHCWRLSRDRRGVGTNTAAGGVAGTA
jgi:hypothetical protein